MFFSLWGRFSLRNNLSKISIIDNPAKLVQLLNNNRIEVKRIDVLGCGDVLMVMYGTFDNSMDHAKIVNDI